MSPAGTDERLEPAGRQSTDSDAPENTSEPSGLAFRVIRQGGWQKGIRLERPFWKALTRAADAADRTLASYIRDMLLRRQSKNQTSVLRVAAIEYLIEELGRTNSATAVKNVVDAMQAAPIPSFALTADKRVFSYNRDFLELVTREVLGDAGRAGMDAVSLALTVPIPKLLEVLSEKGRGGAVVCEFRVTAGDRRMSGQARVLLAPSADTQILVAYVLAERATERGRRTQGGS